jgi:SSS family solute:Na+ symporter
VGGFVLSVIFKFLPLIANLAWLAPLGFAVPVTQERGNVIYEIPFLDRMGFVFVIAVLGMIIISKIDNRRGVTPKGLIVEKSMFRMSPGFAVGAMLICGILIALYTVYW